MQDEPRRHPWLMLLLLFVAVAGVPFVFVGSDAVFVAGLPLWLWWSLVFTIALSALTVLAILKYWRDDEHD